MHTGRTEATKLNQPQHIEQRTQNSCSKITLIVLGILMILAGAAAAGALYPFVGYIALSSLAAVPVGLVAIIIACVCCSRTSPNPDTSRRNSEEEVPPFDDTSYQEPDPYPPAPSSLSDRHHTPHSQYLSSGLNDGSSHSSNTQTFSSNHSSSRETGTQFGERTIPSFAKSTQPSTTTASSGGYVSLFDQNPSLIFGGSSAQASQSKPPFEPENQSTQPSTTNTSFGGSVSLFDSKTVFPKPQPRATETSFSSFPRTSLFDQNPPWLFGGSSAQSSQSKPQPPAVFSLHKASDNITPSSNETPQSVSRWVVSRDFPIETGEQNKETQNKLRALSPDELRELGANFGAVRIRMLDDKQLNDLPWEKIASIPGEVSDIFTYYEIHREKAEQMLHILNHNSLQMIGPQLDEVQIGLLKNNQLNDLPWEAMLKKNTRLARQVFETGPIYEEKTTEKLRALKKPALTILGPALNELQIRLLENNQLNDLPWEEMLKKNTRLAHQVFATDYFYKEVSTEKLRALKKPALTILGPKLDAVQIKLLENNQLNDLPWAAMLKENSRLTNEVFPTDYYYQEESTAKLHALNKESLAILGSEFQISQIRLLDVTQLNHLPWERIIKKSSVNQIFVTGIGFADDHTQKMLKALDERSLQVIKPNLSARQLSLLDS